MTQDTTNSAPAHLLARAHYETGATPSFACRFDQRFSYCLYVPRRGADPAVRAQFGVLAAIHGTDRANQRMRDLCAGFAEEQGVVVVAPLFPAGIDDRDDLNNYKHVEYRGIRFDEVLNHMIDEVRERWTLQAERFSIVGFSGGAQFAHRHVYLHPRRIAAASICAPGSVTAPDSTKPWWVGLGDAAERFGVELDFDALRRVPVQVVVGAKDLETWEITHSPDSPHWMEGANQAGRTRVERAAALASSLTSAGVGVSFEIVPGAGHTLEPLLARALAFFSGASDGGRPSDVG